MTRSSSHPSLSSFRARIVSSALVIGGLLIATPVLAEDTARLAASLPASASSTATAALTDRAAVSVQLGRPRGVTAVFATIAVATRLAPKGPRAAARIDRGSGARRALSADGRSEAVWGPKPTERPCGSRKDS
jgi:hypothetical protein